jgi:hypothetical protein
VCVCVCVSDSTGTKQEEAKEGCQGKVIPEWGGREEGEVTQRH